MILLTSVAKRQNAGLCMLAANAVRVCDANEKLLLSQATYEACKWIVFALQSRSVLQPFTKSHNTNQKEVYSCRWTWGYAAKGPEVRELTFRLKHSSHSCTGKLTFRILQKYNPAKKFYVQHSSHWQDSTHMQPSLSCSYLLEALQLHQFHHFGNIHNAPLLWRAQGFYPKRPKISKAWAALRAWEDCKLHGQRRVYRWIGCLGVTCLQYALTGRNSGKTMWEADMNAFTWGVGQSMQKCGAIEMFFHTFILFCSSDVTTKLTWRDVRAYGGVCADACVHACECESIVQRQHCSRHDYIPWSFLWQEQDLNLSLSPL